MRQRNRLLGRAKASLGAVLAAAVAMLGFSAKDARAQIFEQAQFLFTGDVQLFVVPPGVTEIFVVGFGARGASSGEGIGGPGGVVIGTLAVTPGETLSVYVGGQGCDQKDAVLGCGGFNGGGDARGAGGSAASSGRGGGGGASDVRRGAGTLDDRVLVAAGGGGHCSAASVFPGGSGGGLQGGVGGMLQPGGGGTQDSGGTAFSNCEPGSFGLGGSSNPANTCGGGGGGWYGGGSGCGGGGGSSYIGGLTDASTGPDANFSDGLVVFQWIAVDSLPVGVDIKPGAPNNVINLNGAGKLAVAILGSATFDVLDVDQASLAFGPAAVPPFVWAGASVEDVDGNAIDDLLVYFRQEEAGISMGETQACVTGRTLSSVSFQGCDAITTVACGLGFELVLILPPLVWLRARRRA